MNCFGRSAPVVRSKVDLLQDKRASAVTSRRQEPPFGLGRRSGETDGERRTVRGQGVAEDVIGREDAQEEQEDQEEEVVSLRLVGLGMQLHSKSYSARFSFSMQDLDLEVRVGG